MKQIFPRGVATGEAFYDRVEERKKLKKTLERGVHSVLIAPRRFGKTSLMAQVLAENHYPHVWIDFMTITSVADVEQKFFQKISELVLKIAPTEEKLKLLALKSFALLSPEVVLGVEGCKLVLKPTLSSKQNMLEVLLGLDRLASLTKTRVVIVCDEFQEIVRIDQDATLQAAIRHAAERAQSVSYLFSGSKHRPLRRLFSGKENPLYELCDIVNLERVSREDYEEYLNKAAKKEWGHPLSKAVLERVFYHTEYYPKYINALCDMLWSSGLAPTRELVDMLWDSYMLSRKTNVTDELNGLTLNQIRMVQFLCISPTSEPYGRKFLTDTGLSQGGVQSGLEILLDRDLIIQQEGVYQVIDPAIKYYFSRF